MSRTRETIRTAAEKYLAKALRAKKLFFKENVVICGFEVDLWFPDYRLAIEVDGYTHLSEEQRKRDAHKEQALMNKGILLVRYNNQEIREGLPRCIQEIETLLLRMSSLRNKDSINNDWKETLKKSNFRDHAPTNTKKRFKSIEDYFLSMDKD